MLKWSNDIFPASSASTSAFASVSASHPIQNTILYTKLKLPNRLHIPSLYNMPSSYNMYYGDINSALNHDDSSLVAYVFVFVFVYVFVFTCAYVFDALSRRVKEENL